MKTHFDHAEDLIFRGKGREVINSMRRVVRPVNHNDFHVDIKYDGSPAIFVGIEPKSNKLFVSTKSLFNKTPKFTTDPKLIADMFGEGIAQKLIDVYVAMLDHHELIEPGVVYQGDYLFGPEWRSQFGSVTFEPNTIRYKYSQDNFSSDSQWAGIHWHTIHHMDYSYLNQTYIFGESFMRPNGQKFARTVWSPPEQVIFFNKIMDDDDQQEYLDLLKIAEDYLPVSGLTDSQVTKLQKYINLKLRCSENPLEITYFIKDNNLNEMNKIVWHAGDGVLERMITSAHYLIEAKKILLGYLNSAVPKRGDIGHEGLVIVDPEFQRFKIIDREVFTVANFNKHREWHRG